MNAQAQARQLLEPDAALPAPEPGNSALAWALKDACYAAWTTAPARAARAAEVLRALAGPRSGRAAPLVQGLASWTEAIGALTRGEMAAAVAALDQAQADLLSAGQADAAAQTQVPKIMALSMLGRHAEAAACGRAAQAQLLALGNLGAASRVSMNLGGLHLHRDAYAEAARHYREAAVLFARAGDVTQSVLADIGHASAQSSLGDFDEALRLYARARMRAERQGMHQSLATIDELVAQLELARGHYRPALARLESARCQYEQLGLPLSQAMAQKQLADIYRELRLLPEAVGLFDAALARFSALALPQEQALTLAQRGRAHALLGAPRLADTDFAAAETLFAAQAHEVGQAGVLLARAELALAMQDAPAATQFARAGAERFARAGQTAGALRAAVIEADALLLAGQVARAQAGFEASLAAAQTAQLLPLQVRCHTGLGVALAQAGQAASARQAFEAAIELFEDQRRALPDDELRSAFLGEHRRLFDALLRDALTGDDPAALLCQLERCRARSLDERLGEIGRERGAQAADELRDRLNWLYRRVQRLHEEGTSAAEPEAELRRIEQTLLERARRQRVAQAGGEIEQADRFAPAALQAALAEGDAVVEYGVLDDELFACVVTPSGVRSVRRLSAWSAVLAALQAARFQLDALRHGSAAVGPHLAQLSARAQTRLAQLQALVWAPLAAAVGAAGRVIVVPHEELGALPFAALMAGGQALGQRHQFAFAPSAREALRGLRRPPRTVRRVLALGEPSRLAHAGREAEFVAALFAGGQALVGPAANVAALRERAGAVDLLHFACHAQFRADSPRFSALHLHGEALTADLVEGLALPACTVVLSACDTGRADTGASAEMVGLVRAFLVAGAARVLASLWPVDDRVTADFMARFYARLQDGAPPGLALQGAQAECAASHPHPYYWGAFALYGGW